MNETIRDRIKRRVRSWLLIAVGGWLLFALATAMGRGKTDLPLIALGFTLFAAAILGIHTTVRCPKCSARLGQTIAMPLAFNIGWSPPINFCPYCGVSLDQPCP
jgi:hypothetical protein